MAWLLSQVIFEQPRHNTGNRRQGQLEDPNQPRHDDTVAPADGELNAAELVRPRALPGMMKTFVDLFCAASIFNRKRR